MPRVPTFLVVSREFPPFVGGGIGTYTRRFSEALAGAGTRPIVVTVSADGARRLESIGGVTVVRLPFIAGDDWSGPHPAIATPEARAAFRAFAPVSVFSMRVAAELPRLVDEFAVDAVEVPDTGAPGWFTLNARRTGGDAPGVPIVTMVHSPSAWIARLNHAPPPARRGMELLGMERDAARWSDALLCPSASLARGAEREWSMTPGAVRVVPYPLGSLEDEARASVERPAAGSGALPRRVVFVGRLERRKGVPTLLDAFSITVGRGADLRLDLVGQDTIDPATRLPFGVPRLSAMPAAARERVTWHGRVDPAEASARIARSPIAVVPSPDDNLPYSLIEAMAAGRAVVASRAGGMGELVRDGIDGVLFEPGDAASLADALTRVAAMPDRDLTAFGRAAARRVLEVCGNDRVVAARADHLRSIAGARRSPRASGSVDMVAVNAPPGADLAPLRRAVARGGIDFAHGWTRRADGVVAAFGTPAPETLATGPRALGPMIVRRSALEDARVRAVVPVHADAPAVRVVNTWTLARALCSAGYAGAVVPECVTTLR